AGRSVLRDSRSSLTPALRRSTKPTDLSFFPFVVFSSGIFCSPVLACLDPFLLFPHLQARPHGILNHTCKNDPGSLTLLGCHSGRRAVHPHAVLLRPFGIDAEGVVRSVTDLEHGGGFEERTWQEKTKKGDEPSAQKSGDGSPHQPPTPLVDFTWLGTHGGQTARRCCFGRTHGRRTNIPGCISATGSG